MTAPSTTVPYTWSYRGAVIFVVSEGAGSTWHGRAAPRLVTAIEKGLDAQARAWIDSEAITVEVEGHGDFVLVFSEAGMMDVAYRPAGSDDHVSRALQVSDDVTLLASELEIMARTLVRDASA